MTASTATPRRPSPPGPMALAAVYLALSILVSLLVGAAGPGAGTLWSPGAGLAFGLLLLLGWRSAAVVLLAGVTGGLLTAPGSYAAAPLLMLAGDAATTLVLTAAAVLLRRLARAESPYLLLTRFVGVAVVLAPLGAATAVALVGGAQDAGSWARAVVSTGTAIVTLTPAFVLLARPGLAAAVAVHTVPGRRRWELAAQALLIVVLPAASLLVAGDGREAALLPLALVPLAWGAADADRVRGAAVLAVTGLALGAVAHLRLGVSEGTFRVQLVLFAGALAALFATAGMVADARARRGAEVESTRWRALVEASPVAVARIDPAGTWRPDGSVDEAVADLLARAAAVPAVAQAVDAGVPASVDWGVDDDTGRRFVTRVTPLPDGGSLAVTTETTRLHSAEVALAWERSHDRETDLPNRDLLLATADQALAEGRRASLVLVDVGDAPRRAVLLDVDPVRVLLVTAARLRRHLDPDDLTNGAALVARVGDGQFGVLVPDDVEGARARAVRMVQAVRAPLPAGADALTVSACAGVAPLGGSRGAREALQLAEAALQAAAEGGAQGRPGACGVVVLDHVSVTSSAHRARLRSEVARAVERGELEVAFQPDVTLADGRLTGVEALVRWRRPQGLAAATDTFVQLAEEVGAVRGVDAWVREESLRALGAWRRRPGGRDLELGLNVSALSLTAQLPDDLAAACARHGVPPGRVRLEVTETALADEHQAPRVLAAVKERGFLVALDDFGTGYATLARLHRMPVDVLKLDRSFLPSITDDEQARALVSMVLGLAQLLGMDVVAEGVESPAQRDVLVALGCRRAQGYLFSRPTSADGITHLLASGGRLGLAVHSAVGV